MSGFDQYFLMMVFFVTFAWELGRWAGRYNAIVVLVDDDEQEWNAT